MNSMVATGTLASAYVKAKLKVLASGYAPEILWQKTLRIQDLTEVELLRECAWVILSSGMRESVVSKKFPDIGQAFFDWCSAQEIVWHRDHCIRTALPFFRHERKIEAMASHIREFCDVVLAQLPLYSQVPLIDLWCGLVILDVSNGLTVVFRRVRSCRSVWQWSVRSEDGARAVELRNWIDAVGLIG